MAKTKTTKVQASLDNSARLHEEIIQLYEENRDIVDNHMDYSERWRAVFPDGMILKLCKELRCCPSLIFVALDSTSSEIIILSKIKQKLISFAGIYKITNLITNKSYIGQTKRSFQKRWREHLTHYHTGKQLIYEDMIKYGVDNFKFSIIEIVVNPLRNVLAQRERFWIQQYRTSYIYGGLNQVKPSWERQGSCDIDTIYQYLFEGWTNSEIEQATLVSRKHIASIRNGRIFRKDNITYPILSHADQELIDKYKLVTRLLANADISFEEIHRITGMSNKTVSNIYHGKYSRLFKQYLGASFVFPTRNRKYNNSNIHYDKQRHCLACGNVFKPKNNRSRYCSYECKCVGSRKAIRPDRNTLKRLIRQTSFVNIGRMYGVSDQAVRKWCRAFNLPALSRNIKRYSDEEWEKEIWNSDNKNMIAYDYSSLYTNFLCFRSIKRVASLTSSNIQSVRYALEKYENSVHDIEWSNTSCYIKELKIYFRSAEDVGKWLLYNTRNQCKQHTYFSKQVAKSFKTLPTATVAGYTFTHISEDEFYEVIQHHHVVSYAHDPNGRAS